MKSIKRWNKSLWTGIIFGALAAAYLIMAFYLPPSAKRFGIFGASFMPKLYAIVMLLCAATQLAVGIRQLIREKDQQPPQQTQAEKREKRLNSLNVVLGFALIFLYMLVMKKLGFVLSSALFLFCLCNLLLPKTADRKKAQLIIVLLAVLLPLLSFIFFKNVVHMALPDGPFFGGVL
ncbi:MAG: tripartite tricarboxylate transporter TctB family protein [Clostridia bacterium]|nr:tripartite tricarboxylate transporter TctB family protein [Clostridia bacterium]